VLVETFEEGESVAKFLSRVPAAAAAAAALPSLSSSPPVVASSPAAAAVSSSANDVVGDEKVERQRQQEEWDVALKTSIGVTGMQAFLKMLIWDNFIHADLHPGNGKHESRTLTHKANE
jgi:hypothetical protein